MEIHNRLIFIRKEKKLSREEIAKTVGINQKTIWNWEHGTGEPSVDDLKKIQLATGCRLEWLTLGSGEPFDSPVSASQSTGDPPEIADLRRQVDRLEAKLEESRRQLDHITLQVGDALRQCSVGAASREIEKKRELVSQRGAAHAGAPRV